LEAINSLITGSANAEEPRTQETNRQKMLGDGEDMNEEDSKVTDTTMTLYTKIGVWWKSWNAVFGPIFHYGVSATE
jgi:hypothetical protein